MFVSTQLRSFITFIVGLLFGGAFASIAVLGIAFLVDVKVVTDTTSSGLNTLADVDIRSSSDEALSARMEEYLHTIETSTGSVSSFARKATLYSILIKANRKLLLVFLDDTLELSNSIWRSEIQMAILRRLTTIDPSKVLDLVLRLPIEQRAKGIESVFHEWSTLNLDGAIGAGLRLDFPHREIALKAIVQARIDLSEEERSDIGQRFGYEKYVQRLIDVSRAMELLDTPRRAWEVLTGDGLDVRFRLESMVDIAQTWASQEGVGVLNEILELEDGMLGHSALNLLIVRSVTRSNPEEVFRQAVAKPDTRSYLGEIVRVWAETNPVDALSGVSSLVDASDRPWMTNWIITVWAETNPLELLEERSVLPEATEVHAISSAIVALANTNPLEAVRLMEKLRTEGVNTWPVTVPLVHAWSASDPAGTLDWVVSGSNDDHPQFDYLVELALSRLAPVDPERALELALNPPSSTWPTGLDGEVIREFARKDVDGAAKLLPRVSESSRVRAYIGVGFEYVEGGKPERALELAQQLSQSERDKYYSFTFDSWALIDPHQLLESMKDIPSRSTRSLAAHALIYRNNERHFFSEDQVKHVKTHLNEEDAE